MKQQIPYESTIERDLLYFLEYDPSVKCYQAQPFVITGSSMDGTPHRYTPDFQITRIDSMELVECKPAADMHKAHTQQQLMIGQAWADANQHDFVVITDADLRKGHRLANLKLLWRYSRLSVPPYLTALCIDSLMTQPGGLSFQTLAACLVDTAALAQTSSISNAQATLIQAPYLYSLLFQHILHADLEQPLSPSSRIWLPQRPL
jgi:TnsA endonuclease N terminal